MSFRVRSALRVCSSIRLASLCLVSALILQPCWIALDSNAASLPEPTNVYSGVAGTICASMVLPVAIEVCDPPTVVVVPGDFRLLFPARFVIVLTKLAEY